MQGHPVQAALVHIACRSTSCQVLGCSEGRSASTWVDFNLYGHQIVAHLVPGYNAEAHHNAVDGEEVGHGGAAGAHLVARGMLQGKAQTTVAPATLLQVMPCQCPTLAARSAQRSSTRWLSGCTRRA